MAAYARKHGTPVRVIWPEGAQRELQPGGGLTMTARDADALGRQVAAAVAERLPDAGSLIWAARSAP